MVFDRLLRQAQDSGPVRKDAPDVGLGRAVVTDVGGPPSHGSIVAREYGIPAVLGTGAATSRIRTGQDVRVDGDTGVVTLLPGRHGHGASRG